jgi:predicted enzyme related to lactoylglutathione lyase
MKLKNIYVLVEDTERATSFYTQILGFEHYRKQDRYTILKLDDVWFGLLNEKFLDGAPIKGNNCIPVFEVENVEQEYSRLEKAGVTFVTGVTVLPDVKFFQFYDSEKNILEMYQEE